MHFLQPALRPQRREKSIMRVKCISQCQSDRKILFEVGKIYDIDKKLYKNNTDRFEKITVKTKEERE